MSKQSSRRIHRISGSPARLTTLVGANELVAARAGLSTGDFAEFQINRFGLRLPEEFRPPPGGTLSPEAQAWVETNFGFGPQSRVAIDALDGIPYYEWEQMVLAPDLRPYVTSVQPNPLWAESAGPLGLRPGRPPIFDPATNPQTLFGLGQAPGGWPRVMTYLDWMRAQSAAGSLPYTTTELAGVERVTMLGGRPLYVPVGAPLVPDLLAEPPIEDRDISPAQEEGYLSWLRQTTGAPEALTGGSQASPASAADVSALLGHAAAEVREAGGRIVGLRISPGVGYVEARVDTPDAADAVVSSLVSISARIPPDFDLGIKLVVENASVDFAGRYDSLDLSPRVRLVIQNAAGLPLYFR
jgi:hypothetical protein